MSKKSKPLLDAEQFNTIINGMIFKYSTFVGMDTRTTYENMEKFYQQFLKETNQHEESFQLGQDDQTKQKSL